MKKFAFLVLVFAATVTAEGAGIKEWAQIFKTDVATVEMCLSESGTTEAELQAIQERYDKLPDSDSDDETKKDFKKYNGFIACMLEKNELMKNSKLVVDKIMEDVEDKDIPHINTDVLRDCLNALNDDSTLTREDRAIGGLVTCSNLALTTSGSEEKNKKK